MTYFINMLRMTLITLLIVPFMSSYLYAEMHEKMHDEMEHSGEPVMYEEEMIEMEIVGETYEDAMIGKVLLIGDNIIRIREDSSDKVYDLYADQDMLENVSTGHRVAVRTDNGKVTFIEVLGLHKEAEPVIIYEE